MGSMEQDSNRIKSHWVGYRVSFIWIKKCQVLFFLSLWNKRNTSYLLWISTNLVVPGHQAPATPDPLTRSLYSLPPVWLYATYGLATDHAGFWTAGLWGCGSPLMEAWKWTEEEGKDYQCPPLTISCSGLLYLLNTMAGSCMRIKIPVMFLILKNLALVL